MSVENSGCEEEILVLKRQIEALKAVLDKKKELCVRRRVPDQLSSEALVAGSVNKRWIDETDLLFGRVIGESGVAGNPLPITAIYKIKWKEALLDCVQKIKTIEETVRIRRESLAETQRGVEAMRKALEDELVLAGDPDGRFEYAGVVNESEESVSGYACLSGVGEISDYTDPAPAVDDWLQEDRPVFLIFRKVI